MSDLMNYYLDFANKFVVPPSAYGKYPGGWKVEKVSRVRRENPEELLFCFMHGPSLLIYSFAGNHFTPVSKDLIHHDSRESHPMDVFPWEVADLNEDGVDEFIVRRTGGIYVYTVRTVGLQYRFKSPDFHEIFDQKQGTVKIHFGQFVKDKGSTQILAVYPTRMRIFKFNPLAQGASTTATELIYSPDISITADDLVIPVQFVDGERSPLEIAISRREKLTVYQILDSGSEYGLKVQHESDIMRSPDRETGLFFAHMFPNALSPALFHFDNVAITLYQHERADNTYKEHARLDVELTSTNREDMKLILKSARIVQLDAENDMNGTAGEELVYFDRSKPDAKTGGLGQVIILSEQNGHLVHRIRGTPAMEKEDLSLIGFFQAGSSPLLKRHMIMTSRETSLRWGWIRKGGDDEPDGEPLTTDYDSSGDRTDTSKGPDDDSSEPDDEEASSSTKSSAASILPFWQLYSHRAEHLLPSLFPSSLSSNQLEHEKAPNFDTSLLAPVIVHFLPLLLIFLKLWRLKW